MYVEHHGSLDDLTGDMLTLVDDSPFSYYQPGVSFVLGDPVN